MSKRTVLSLPVLALVIAAGTAFAQAPSGIGVPQVDSPKSAEPQKFYKLEFVVKEVEGGKVLNARTYSMTAAAGAQNAASIRAGSKVPVASGGFPGQPQNYRQFQYVDVGVNIDCRSIVELQRDISLNVTAEISSLPSEPAAAATAGDPNIPPMVRQNKWSSWTVVPLKKATLIFSSDDLASKRQMQLELTATPIL